MDLDWTIVDPIIERALREDVGCGDVTTEAVVPASATAEASIVARESGSIAGLPVAGKVFLGLSSAVRFMPRIDEGAPVAAGEVLATVAGPAQALLTGERLALNFLQRLSGIATLTRRCLDAVAGHDVKILDTRKTTPGLRYLEKYAVRVAGGVNHRSGLYDQVLIKDNHIALADGSIALAIERTRRRWGNELTIEVEADTLDQVHEALAAGVDIIMLDNMSDDDMRRAVAVVRESGPDGERPETEASGGISLERLAAVADTGVDRISLGALTHSAPSLDIAMDIDIGRCCAE